MNLLTDNLKKLYLKFLIPSLGSAMVMSIYTLTDAIVIGKGIGAAALAALSITTPLLCIIFAVGILFGVGGSVQTNICRGMKEENKANEFFTLSFLFLLLIAIILWIVYVFNMPSLLKLMGANDNLFPYAMDYMFYFDMFLPVAVFSNFIAIYVRADKDPNRTMVAVIAGGIVNIILDIIFVFYIKLGMGGAALASAIGMVLQALISGSHFISKKNYLKFRRPTNTIKKFILIFTNGIPSFFNEFANGFIVLLFNIQFLKYCGTNALSIYSVISTCVILFNSLFTGVGQAIQPIVSMNYGAKNIDRVLKTKKMCITTIIIMGVIFSLSGIIFPNVICNIFIPTNKELLNIASYGIRLYFITFLPLGLNLAASYYLQAILKTKPALIISLLRNIVLSSILIIVFPILFGGNSLFIVMPVVEFIILILSIKYFKY